MRTEEGRKIRHAFVAEPGHVLLSADYSQIELRLLAHVAEIDALKQAFHDGVDIHAMTAVAGVRYSRRGHGPDGPPPGQGHQLRHHLRHLGLRSGAAVGHPQRRGQGIHRGLFRPVSGHPQIHGRDQGFCGREKGYVSTLFGRRVHLRGINDKNPNARGFAERAAINAPIQGGAADIIKRAMIRIPGALADAGLSARMLLQVHDELIFELPEAETDATTDCVRKVMEQAADLSVPLVADAGHGPSWAEAH